MKSENEKSRNECSDRDGDSEKSSEKGSYEEVVNLCDCGCYVSRCCCC